LHGDDTTVPLLARGGTKTARLWTYVRDDRPFDDTAPPAVVFHFSRDRGGEHPTEHLRDWRGILQADAYAYAGYNPLYDPGRQPGPVASALCWSHARRKFFELADVETNVRKGKSTKDISPIALEAVRRIDAVFEIERSINGQPPEARLEVRKRLSASLVADLERWLRGERAQLSRHAKVAKAIDYLLSPNHWPGFNRFLEDGRICLTNNAAERALRGVALGRRSWLFAGSERGGQRAAVMYTLIGTAKLNGNGEIHHVMMSRRKPLLHTDMRARNRTLRSSIQGPAGRARRKLTSPCAIFWGSCRGKRYVSHLGRPKNHHRRLGGPGGGPRREGEEKTR
jgi:transposase